MREARYPTQEHHELFRESRFSGLTDCSACQQGGSEPAPINSVILDAAVGNLHDLNEVHLLPVRRRARILPNKQSLSIREPPAAPMPAHEMFGRRRAPSTKKGRISRCPRRVPRRHRRAKKASTKAPSSDHGATHHSCHDLSLKMRDNAVFASQIIRRAGD